MRLNLKKIIGNVLFASVLLLVIGRFLSIIAGTPFPMSVIASHSMEPALLRGDVLPWVPCNLEDVHEGDVVVYKSANSWGKEIFIAHRVVSIIESNGKTMLITKGDSNNYTDQSGPHIPEPPVNSKMLKGKAIMLGKQPLKLPFAGYPWLIIQGAFVELSKPMSWGKPQSDAHYIIFAPAAISLSMLVAGIVIWAPENGKSLKDKLREQIFGPERISPKRIFSYILLFYLIFLMIASSFSYDRLSSSIGVEKVPPKSAISFGNMSYGEQSFPKSVNIVNPSLFPIRGIVFASGNISSFLEYKNRVFTLKNGERFSGNITAYVPQNIEPGIYTGSIYIYSSPYWMLMPSSSISFLYDWSPKGTVILLSIVSAWIMATITSILLFAMSFVVERYLLEKRYLSWAMLPVHVKLHPFYSKIPSLNIKKKFVDIFRWMNGELHWIDFDIKKPLISSIIGFAAVSPLIYIHGFRNFVYMLFLASFMGGVVAYIIGCRWRAEIMFSALVTNAIFSLIFASTAFFHIFRTNHSLLVPFSSSITIAGIIMFIFAIMAVPACLFSWLPGYAIHSLRERLDYRILLKRCDI